MKTRDDIQEDLLQITHEHYYAEDFMLESTFRAYASGLLPGESQLLADVVAERLAGEGSLVDILLCTVVNVPGAGALLTAILSREERASQYSRALMLALRGYGGEEAYRAIERFLDSDQEPEALQAMLAIDFVRSLPVMAGRLRRASCINEVVHGLYRRMGEVGMAGLMQDLKACPEACSPRFTKDLEAALGSLAERYNPFSQEEIGVMMTALKA